MNAHQKIIKDNVRSILKIITNHYGVKYSAALYQILKEHPDFPSFLSFQYILHRMGKDSFAIHTSYEELTNMPAPFHCPRCNECRLILIHNKSHRRIRSNH